MPYKTLHSETLYRGRVFNVRQDQVSLPDGKSTRWDIIEHHGAVAILPVDDQGRIIFVRQYRHATGEELLELPAGVTDEGEDPAASAARELREEIGLSAGDLEELGGFYLAPGYSTEFLRVFLARDLQPDPLTGDEDEAITLEAIPWEEAYALARRGEIRDAKSLAALFLAQGKPPVR